MQIDVILSDKMAIVLTELFLDIIFFIFYIIQFKKRKAESKAKLIKTGILDYISFGKETRIYF